ncbi:MAG: aspartate dehydrogenase [Firmicutes bacterium]|nr:aspartate dehydrogenase [Bacillota bacterium]
MSLFHKKEKTRTYDRDNLEPVIRSSICTGEKAAGFRDKTTGHFTEVMLIGSDQDLQKFIHEYGITEEIQTIY